MSDVINLDIVAEPDNEELQRCKDETSRWKHLYEQQCEVARNIREQWATDIQHIGERLIQEADDRGFCTDFDDVIASLNGKLLIELPTRRKEYVITQVVQVTRSLTVYAKDADEAMDNLSAIGGVYDLDRHGWSIDDIDIYEESAEEQ